MLRSIFVPLDGSLLSERALAPARGVARAASADIVLCRVLTSTDLPSSNGARAYLERIAQQLESRGHSVKTATTSGSPASAIVAAAHAHHADLLVMATHRRSAPGRVFFGSVADEVLRTATMPVLMVPTAPAAQWMSGRIARILVPLDGSHRAESALAPVAELAKLFESEILLLKVVPFPPFVLYGNGIVTATGEAEHELWASEDYLARIADRLRVQGFTVRTQAEVADPIGVITELARSQDTDLIAMATHGRAGLARMAFGSVATSTLQRANVPLLLMGPAAFRQRHLETEAMAAGTP